MKFTFVTLFPSIMECYFKDSILKKAVEKSLLHIEFINPRDYSTNKHNKVDAPLVGGGAGMLMTPQPLSSAIEDIKQKSPKAHTIFLTPSAKPFKQKDAKRLSLKEHIVLISGRYEGFDERVIELYADELFSTGDYILTGGELPSLIVCDAISRNIPGVLGNDTSLDEESFEDELLESPSFTKPDVFKKNSLIKEFLKGNHGKIASLKYDLSLLKTKYYRPDLYEKAKTRIKNEK